jgi:hypothetical protein
VRWTKGVLWITGLGVLGAGILVSSYRLLGAAAGTEAGLIAIVQRSEREGLTLAVPGAASPLVSGQVHFDRFSASIEPREASAHVTCTLDFTGSIGATKVSSVGLEKIPFKYQRGQWVASSGFAPRLTRVVAALEARRQSLETADRPGLRQLLSSNADPGSLGAELDQILSLGARRYQAIAWFIREERDRAIVTEEYHLTGRRSREDVDEKGTRRLQLERREEQFLFSKGIL